MKHYCGQAAMVHADHVDLWWGVETLIPLLKHIKYFYFCVKSMCRLMPTQGKWVGSWGSSLAPSNIGSSSSQRNNDIVALLLPRLLLLPCRRPPCQVFRRCYHCLVSGSSGGSMA